MTKKHQGSCLCGVIRFSVGGFSEQVANCHCTMCRKFHGAAFGTLVAVTELEWLSGHDHLTEYTAPNGTTRSFCRRCGSSISFRSKGANVKDIEIAIGLFEAAIPVTVDAQIFTENKANWCALYNDIPAFEQSRKPKT